MFGHFRLSQDTDNQTKVYVVVSKRKEEVGLSFISAVLFVCCFTSNKPIDCRLSAEGVRVPEESVLQAEPRP